MGVARLRTSEGELGKVIAQRDALHAQLRDLTTAASPAAYWKGLAQDTQKQLVQTQDRLTALTGQLDELRKRVTSTKAAHSAALDRVNALQADLVTVASERDDLASRLVTQETIKRRLWELFAAL